ncbi:nuclear transport factor 2 family protein [Luteimonas vadosa]|uniref:Nuclear transport factor 2 family protein n=2 Tax=Luteimonas vadosa TaxID=1165507 RepID=A0ABP9E1E0_9GAMM
MLLAAVLLLSGCTRGPSEQALRLALDGLQEAVEDRDAAGIERYLAEDFIGPEGIDRAGARRLAAVHLMRHGVVGMDVVGPLDLRMGDGHATVRFTAAMTGGQGGLLPESGQVYAVQTGWKFQGGQWLLASADWKRTL